MANFPDQIAVRCVERDREVDRPLDRVLVAVRFQVQGEYYYGCVAGVSDGDGRVRITRIGVEQAYLHDQATFPMDYRLDVSAVVDSDCRIVVDGGRGFVERRRSALSSPLVTKEIRGMYLAARNEELSAGEFSLGLRSEGELLLPLTVGPAREMSPRGAVH